MKEEILRLRAEGKTYNEIKKVLGCSKSTIAYHCGEGQKEKTKKRRVNLRKKNPLLQKTDRFKNVKHRLHLYSRDGRKGKYGKLNFTYKDVFKKFSENPKCYLTGDIVSLYDANSFALDHIIPRSRGGANTLDNMGITTPEANQAKHKMLVSEFLELCEKVLKNHGYKIDKPTGE
jgi:5-methylcytosine-specific restriction endonuclease McrA